MSKNTIPREGANLISKLTGRVIYYFNSDAEKKYFSQFPKVITLEVKDWYEKRLQSLDKKSTQNSIMVIKSQISQYDSSITNVNMVGTTFIVIAISIIIGWLNIAASSMKSFPLQKFITLFYRFEGIVLFLLVVLLISVSWDSYTRAHLTVVLLILEEKTRKTKVLNKHQVSTVNKMPLSKRYRVTEINVRNPTVGRRMMDGDDL